MGVIDRWSRLGSLTGKLAGRFVGERVRDRVRSKRERLRARREEQVRQARELAEQLGQLKGAAMKVGQQVSMLAVQLDLPEEVQAPLRKLHAEAKPVPWHLIRQTIESSLGCDVSEHFQSIDRTPLGTASLAQAHAGVLHDGTEVVVKVLHPGVRESVQADLLAVRGLLYGGLALGRSRKELDVWFDELQERLLEELDYLQEAVSLQQFADVFGDHPRFVVPRHHPHLCSDVVLTMDRLHGQPLEAFVQSASDEARDAAGHNLAALFLEMAFRHRLLHADPHPGNYLFYDDGRIGLIDFGCVKRFSLFWMGSYAKVALAALEGDDETMLQGVREMGAWTSDDPEAAAVLVDFCNVVVGPLREGPYTIGGADDAVIERVRPVVERMWRYPEIQAPRDIIFLHRTLGGMYGFARKLKIRDDWMAVLRPYLEEAIEAAS